MQVMIRWALGFVVGEVWGAANLFSTMSILKISVLKKDPRRLSALLLLKFPVLYLIGFLILISKAFPAMSLLTGLLAAAVTIGIAQLWPKQA